MIRCKDIAALVGVSRQAVTAVLNNSRPNCVSEEKRKKILMVAAEHNYRPNHVALALKTGRSNLVGIVNARLEQSVYRRTLHGDPAKSCCQKLHTAFYH